MNEEVLAHLEHSRSPLKVKGEKAPQPDYPNSKFRGQMASKSCLSLL
jgi:hypothetical protein